jgi:hypothetical protein
VLSNNKLSGVIFLEEMDSSQTAQVVMIVN